MSLQFRIADQVLRVDDASEGTDALVHKYDAFLNLLCDDRHAFLRDAVRAAWCFLVSDKYPDLERLARENYNAREVIRQRHDSVDTFLARMPLRAKKAASLDLATGAGKSWAMYALAALALAEGLVDRVLVLCPSLTIEEALLEKFSAFAGNAELSAILRELGAAVAIPGIRRGNTTVGPGEICIENIHAVYENTGTSIGDSFRGNGARTLVLNDEAHHLFSPPDKGMKKWMEFLLNEEFGFRFIVNVTGTPYIADDYFADVVFRYGLKQAIEAKVVKKPNYVLAQTTRDNGWAQTCAIHEKNREDYGATLKPITIVVTQEIVRCVEVWRELVDFLAKKEKLTSEDAERRVIWVTSGIPSNAAEKARVAAACPKRNADDSPEKRRKENLAALRGVDDAASPVEWIVSVSMLTEGWDVKNVFQIVPHDSRAFSSKLLIAQVLGRGLRVPPGLDREPLVWINNHEKWSPEIASLLRDVLEIENTLSWGFQPSRERYVFPLHNLRYEPEQTTVETKRKPAAAPKVTFMPQERKTTEFSTFSETGALAVEIEHLGATELDDAVSMMRLFLREKDEEIAATWPKEKLREFIVAALRAGGYDETFLSKENRLLLQQSFGPMFRETDKEHPRMSQMAQEVVPVNLAEVPRQSFSESGLKEHGSVWYVSEEPPEFSGAEVHLWEQWQKWKKIAGIDESGLSEDVRRITGRMQQVDLRAFKSPWNVHYASHEPEREFSRLLFAQADLFEAFVKMPNQGGYAFPYSYKPAKAAKTHTANENFNPDFFIRVRAKHDLLVVEVKQDDDDTNRNRAKCRDGLKHFATLNAKITELGEPWRYHFYFLSPEDFTKFFERVRLGNYAGWMSGLMQHLMSREAGAGD